MGIDRLSALPDDLLRRILYFAPAKEGASTAVLSRRWRSLWPASGAVNIDTNFYSLYISRHIRKAFFRGAGAALAAAQAHGHIKKFSLLVEADDSCEIRRLLRRRWIHALLSNPAIKHVEELHIGAAETCEEDEDEDFHITSSTPDTTELYKLNFGALPSEALRVLHIVNCRNLKPPPPLPATFPQLASLHLQGCIFSLICLQRVIDAAPQLATVILESFSFSRDRSGTVQSCYQLHCRAVTSLVLKDCNWWSREDEGALELDAPKLRYFVFTGPVDHCHTLSLNPAPTNMVQVDLHLTDGETSWQMNYSSSIPLWFWKFIQNFNITKLFKLKLDFAIHSVAVASRNCKDDHRGDNMFRNLEQLELDVHYNPACDEATAMAVANILHCCPVIRDLHLKLKQVSTTDYFLNHKGIDRLDFDKSVNHFRRHKRTRASIGRDYDSEKCEISDDTPGFCRDTFNCLESHIRRVSLKFWMETPGCFGVQLAKFLAKKAMVLEEMIIDDGSQKMCDHINHKIGRWIHTKSSKRKIMQCSLGLGYGEPYGTVYHVGKRRRR